MTERMGDGAAGASFLADQSNRARDWLLSAAYPLWFSKGIDWVHGGFFDALDHVNGENAAPRKRLRVAARQIYVFSEGARLGFEGGEVAVRHGLDFLFMQARHPDGAFISHFDLASNPARGDRDSYDLAFVLFALAHAYSLLNDECIFQEAEQVAAFFETRLRDSSGGFLEGLPSQLPRRQNPHMHLLEACIAWLPKDRNGTFRRLADELVHLFETVFCDLKTGAIREYFTQSWGRTGDLCRDAVEPGHLFEWCWLLSAYAQAASRACPALPRIYSFAKDFGRNENGLLFGELYSAGSVQDRSVRLWPHAEWVRAELSYGTTSAGLDRSGLEASLSALWRFLDTPLPGLWFERFEAPMGEFKKEPAPASSLYHIVGAFSALIDQAEAVTRNEPGSLPKPPRSVACMVRADAEFAHASEVQPCR